MIHSPTVFARKPIRTNEIIHPLTVIARRFVAEVIHKENPLIENKESQGDFIESLCDSTLSFRRDSTAISQFAESHFFAKCLPTYFNTCPAPLRTCQRLKREPNETISAFLLRFAYKPSATLLGRVLANSRFLYKERRHFCLLFSLFMHHEAERELVRTSCGLFLFLDLQVWVSCYATHASGVA